MTDLYVMIDKGSLTNQRGNPGIRTRTKITIYQRDTRKINSKRQKRNPLLF